MKDELAEFVLSHTVIRRRASNKGLGAIAVDKARVYPQTLHVQLHIRTLRILHFKVQIIKAVSIGVINRYFYEVTD